MSCGGGSCAWCRPTAATAARRRRFALDSHNRDGSDQRGVAVDEKRLGRQPKRNPNVSPAFYVPIWGKGGSITCVMNVRNRAAIGAL